MLEVAPLRPPRADDVPEVITAELPPLLEPLLIPLVEWERPEPDLRPEDPEALEDVDPVPEAAEADPGVPLPVEEEAPPIEPSDRPALPVLPALCVAFTEPAPELCPPTARPDPENALAEPSVGTTPVDPVEGLALVPPIDALGAWPEEVEPDVPAEPEPEAVSGRPPTISSQPVQSGVPRAASAAAKLRLLKDFKGFLS